MDYTLLIFYVTLALGVSFLCSILEAIVLSIPHTHIAVMEKDGSKIGKIWGTLKDDDAVKPLTAILTLNTIAHHGCSRGWFRSSETVWRRCFDIRFSYFNTGSFVPF